MPSPAGVCDDLSRRELSTGTPFCGLHHARKSEARGGRRSSRCVAGTFPVLGVAFDAMQIPDVIDQMRQWIAWRQACRYIAVAGMHGITEARHNAEFRKAVADADLVVADGMPVVWLGRLRGHSMPRRVYGPELMLRFCKETAIAGYRHYLLGGAPGVPEQLARSIEKVCPGITIVGTHSPPFRASTSEEDAETHRKHQPGCP